MKVGASAVFDGVTIVEAVSETSNSCPASFGNQCAGSSSFTVGAGGSTFGQTFPAATNTFYDQHASTSASSALDAAGINSCSSSCKQVYSCGGTPIGTFTINRSFTKGTIQGTPVTNVTVTKN
jgi:hypothetical protein